MKKEGVKVLEARIRRNDVKVVKGVMAIYIVAKNGHGKRVIPIPEEELVLLIDTCVDYSEKLRPILKSQN